MGGAALRTGGRPSVRPSVRPPVARPSPPVRPPARCPPARPESGTAQRRVADPRRTAHAQVAGFVKCANPVCRHTDRRNNKARRYCARPDEHGGWVACKRMRLAGHVCHCEYSALGQLHKVALSAFAPDLPATQPTAPPNSFPPSIHHALSPPFRHSWACRPFSVDTSLPCDSAAPVLLPAEWTAGRELRRVQQQKAQARNRRSKQPDQNALAPHPLQ